MSPGSPQSRLTSGQVPKDITRLALWPRGGCTTEHTGQMWFVAHLLFFFLYDNLYFFLFSTRGSITGFPKTKASLNWRDHDKMGRERHTRSRKSRVLKHYHVQLNYGDVSLKRIPFVTFCSLTYKFEFLLYLKSATLTWVMHAIWVKNFC